MIEKPTFAEAMVGRQIIEITLKINNMKSKVLVIGGTGKTGRKVAQKLTVYGAGSKNWIALSQSGI